MKKILFPLFVQIQALGPFLGARSRDLLQIPPIESSVRFNLTDLVTKEGSVFASKNVPFYHTPLFTAAIAFKDITYGKMGNVDLPRVYTLNPTIPSFRR